MTFIVAELSLNETFHFIPFVTDSQEKNHVEENFLRGVVGTFRGVRGFQQCVCRGTKSPSRPFDLRFKLGRHSSLRYDEQHSELLRAMLNGSNLFPTARRNRRGAALHVVQHGPAQTRLIAVPCLCLNPDGRKEAVRLFIYHLPFTIYR